jgi:hypothetical protein
MVLTELAVGSVVVSALFFMSLISSFLIFIDYFGGINFIFAVSPFKPTLLSSIMTNFGEFLKLA